MKKAIYNIPQTAVVELDLQGHLMDTVAPSANGSGEYSPSSKLSPQRIWRD